MVDEKPQNAGPWYRCPHTKTCPRYNGCMMVHYGPNPPDPVCRRCGVRQEELTWETWERIDKKGDRA